MSVRRESYKAADGSIREHWRVDVVFIHPDGRRERVRKVSPVPTRRGAEQYERDLRQALLAGKRREEATKETPTLSQFADDFLATYAKANNKPSEYHSKKRWLEKHLLPVLGKLRLDELSTRDIEAYKARKLSTHKAKSVNNHLATLRTLLAQAIEWGEIEKAPRVKACKVAPADIRWLQDDELERFLAAADERWRPVYLVAARTGLRLGELRALRWVDVDLRAAVLHVRHAAWMDEIGTPKGGKARDVPLSPEAVAALSSLPRPLRPGLVWPGLDGELGDYDAWQWAIHRDAEKAGLEAMGWHALRHTCASMLVRRGVELPVVQRILGHSDIRTTMRYAHLAPGATRDAVAVLDAPSRKETASA